jgi:hypothetical protein
MDAPETFDDKTLFLLGSIQALYSIFFDFCKLSTISSIITRTSPLKKNIYSPLRKKKDLLFREIFQCKEILFPSKSLKSLPAQFIENFCTLL